MKKGAKEMWAAFFITACSFTLYVTGVAYRVNLFLRKNPVFLVFFCSRCSSVVLFPVVSVFSNQLYCIWRFIRMGRIDRLMRDVLVQVFCGGNPCDQARVSKITRVGKDYSIETVSQGYHPGNRNVFVYSGRNVLCNMELRINFPNTRDGRILSLPVTLSETNSHTE